jgi:WD40 repeat protein
MTLDQFLGRLESDNARHKGAHKLGKPATEAAVAAWQKKHAGHPLPAEYVALLVRANGLTLFPTRDTPRGAVTLFPVSKIDVATKTITGDVADDTFPGTWLALGVDGNGDWWPCYDVASGKYVIGDYSGEEETLDSFEHFLDWLRDSILDSGEYDGHLRAAPEPAVKAPKAAKGKTQAVAVLEPVRVGLGHLRRLMGVAVSPDGRLAATAAQTNDGSKLDGELPLRLWDLATGAQVGAGPDSVWPDGMPVDWYGVAFTPDGKRVLAGTGRSFVVHDVADPAAVKRGAVVPGPETVGTLEFSPDGSLLLAAAGNFCFGSPEAFLFDGRTLEPVRKISVHKKTLTCARWTPDGARIVTAGWDKAVRVSDARTGEVVGDLGPQKYTVASVAVSPDGTRVLCGSWTDKAVTLWDWMKASVVAQFPGHKGPVRAVAFSKDGGRVVTLDGKGVVRVWDVASGAEMVRSAAPTSERLLGNQEGTGLALTPDGGRVVAVGYDGAVRVFEMPG